VSPLLELAHLAAGYGDVRAVWDVSVAVDAGSIAVLLGRNGAGKTTTLRAVCGLATCFAGDVLFAGEPLARLTPWQRAARGVALVPDGRRVFRGMTVEENLVVGGYVLRHRRHRVLARLDDVYDRFPILASRRDVRADRLSGGQQQMLAIAQALVARPRVLLLDEPSGGLAPAIVRDVFDTLVTLRDEGLAVLLVEQSVQAALRVADTVTVIDLGRSQAVDPSTGGVEAVVDAYFGSGTGSRAAAGPGSGHLDGDGDPRAGSG
jgi:branched-chain amino acid transport system ATP-binding protein